MKIDVKKVGSDAKGFFVNNREIFGSVVSAAVFAGCCKAFGIQLGSFGNPFEPFGVRVRTSIPDNTGTVVVSIEQPKTAIESAIYSFYKNAISMNDDYYRNIEANKILNVVKKSDRSDAVKSYAIEAITGIADVTKDSYYRSLITGKVTDILNIKEEV